jgi:hypothetical protein
MVVKIASQPSMMNPGGAKLMVRGVKRLFYGVRSRLVIRMMITAFRRLRSAGYRMGRFGLLGLAWPNE